MFILNNLKVCEDEVCGWLATDDDETAVAASNCLRFVVRSHKNILRMKIAVLSTDPDLNSATLERIKVHDMGSSGELLAEFFITR